jgi:hypothetical protein
MIILKSIWSITGLLELVLAVVTVLLDRPVLLCQGAQRLVCSYSIIKQTDREVGQ